MKSLIYLSILLIPVLCNSNAYGTGRMEPRLAYALANAGDDETVVAWVFFTDKGPAQSDVLPSTLVSPRSLQRRLKVRSLQTVVDYSDVPLHDGYVQSVAEMVGRIRQRSKWFNAVSVEATPRQIELLLSLPFVEHVDLVARFANDNSEVETGLIQKEASPPSTSSIYDFNYGPSLNQVQQINVPAVHNTGNYAQGVMVGVFDNGFRLPNHEAFAMMDIIATYDFVDHKVSVVPNNPSSAYGSHGVNTLSTIGGNSPGHLIGPAFGATFILARTENDSSETPIEEDNWVAAIEWADSIGVDVTSTSLGYLDYTSPFPSWTWEDMNGNTTVITRAADMAVGRGILVLNSAGNGGSNPSQNTLGAPADGDSVLAIGAVTASGARSGFSSVGPTTDIPPRIKPDIMAQGSSVVVASSTNPTGYGTSQGTSFSCPLAAGAAALVLHAVPAATPMQVAAALKATASNATNPNNLMGWGIIDAQAAITYLLANGAGNSQTLPEQFVLEQNYPNPFNPSTTIRYQIPEASHVSVKVYDILGRDLATLIDEYQSAQTYSITWNGTNRSGMFVAGGTYIYRMVVEPSSGKVSSQSRVMTLLK